MRKIGFIMLCFILISVLGACAGNTAGVKIEPYVSETYRDREIRAAINTITSDFRKNFSGCTLTMITYAGDETTQKYAEWAERYDADDVIVLTSSFTVDASGGDGSLNPNFTYTGWQWILVRKNGGRWRHVDHGY